jgi:ABC-type branched-subunit amino acid transport system ATPase component
MYFWMIKDITEDAMYRRAQKGIGYLAQEASVFRKLSVEDNIKAVLEMTKLSKEEQRDKLEQLIDEFSLHKVRRTGATCFREEKEEELKFQEHLLPIQNSSFWTNHLPVLTPSQLKKFKVSWQNLNCEISEF